MKVERYIKQSSDKYLLILDNGEVIETFEDVIVDNRLAPGKELNNNLINKIEEENTVYKYYKLAVSHIKSRLRSEKEIIKFLEKKEVSNETIDKVLVKLNKSNLINDDYFCKCFINDKLKFTTWGEYKIINELKKAGITENIIENNSNLFDKNVLEEKALKLIEKYKKSSKNRNIFYLRNKIYKNLINQGYSKDMILKLINSLE